MEEEKRDLRSVKLLASLLLNIGITVAQVIGGILSGSLALLSDALHNLSDVVALAISWVALRISRQEYSPRRTFGTRRIELLAALINGCMLVGISAFLLMEAIARIGQPPEVDSMVVIILAGAAVLINGVSALMFHSDAKESLNIRSVYLNLLTDMFSSVAVLIGGLLMLHYGLFWVDIVLTALISIALLYAAIRLLREAGDVFMLFTPRHIDLLDLERSMTSIGPVTGVHHIHIWKLVDDEIHLEAHVEFLDDLSISVLSETLDEMQEMLQEKFGITHVTLQPEHGREDVKDLVLSLGERDHSQGL